MMLTVAPWRQNTGRILGEMEIGGIRWNHAKLVENQADQWRHFLKSALCSILAEKGMS
jgi:hypothetical protein